MIESLHQLLRRDSALINRHTLGVAAVFSAKVVASGVGFLVSIMLARLLGAGGLGLYFLAMTIIGIGATVSRLGLENVVLRYAAVASERNDRSTLAALYRKSMGLVTGAGVFVGGLIFFLLPQLTLGGERSAELQRLLPLALMTLLPGTLILLQGEFFKAVGRPGMGTLVQETFGALLMAAGTGLFFLFGVSGVERVVLLQAVSVGLVLLLAALVWHRCQPGLWRLPGSFDTGVLLRTGFPLLWVTGMSLVMNWTDILVLGYWSDPAVVGMYGVANRVAMLTVFILTTVNSVTAPRFAALYAEEDHRGLRRLAQQSAGWMLLAALPVILLLLIAPGWVLQFFGADFAKGSPLLRILVLGQFVNLATGSVGYLLMMTGHERIMRNLIALAAGLNLAGNLLLVPLLGAEGAAVSTALSLALMNLGSFVMVKRKLGINTLGYLKGMIS
ncbi:hypothetical protein C2E25_06885 [Geothermobacter hydrogeniphilus]|uniref:Uncharacterized protein n=1 Tax=Geothermobacter hydrogeniphilus TaxID=1969733 RepID=A0A2K2HBA7_9BACT|nr:oligosaccharide flippase family protein [Geothermobacter hydrogeniphilus]PNU20594.1 hypothetical protein C2E25_06885 [Geothermobacter hydrogeniphilus]